MEQSGKEPICSTKRSHRNFVVDELLCPACHQHMRTNGPRRILCLISCRHCLCTACHLQRIDEQLVNSPEYLRKDLIEVPLHCPVCDKLYNYLQAQPFSFDCDAICRRIHFRIHSIDAWSGIIAGLQSYCRAMIRMSNELDQLNTLDDRSSLPEESGPSVVISEHLQVQSADFSHLSFGSFKDGAPNSPSLTSVPVRTNMGEATSEADATVVGQSETRYHRAGASALDCDSPSASQQEPLEPQNREVEHENQYAYPTSSHLSFGSFKVGAPNSPSLTSVPVRINMGEATSEADATVAGQSETRYHRAGASALDCDSPSASQQEPLEPQNREVEHENQYAYPTSSHLSFGSFKVGAPNSPSLTSVPVRINMGEATSEADATVAGQSETRYHRAGASALDCDSPSASQQEPLEPQNREVEHENQYAYPTSSHLSFGSFKVGAPNSPSLTSVPVRINMGEATSEADATVAGQSETRYHRAGASALDCDSPSASQQEPLEPQNREVEHENQYAYPTSSHLSFGSFKVGAPNSPSLTSVPVRIKMGEATSEADATVAGQSETRYHRAGASALNCDSPSASQQEPLKHQNPEVELENQYAYPTSSQGYTFENTQQPNITSSQTHSVPQMQNNATFSNVMTSKQCKEQSVKELIFPTKMSQRTLHLLCSACHQNMATGGPRRILVIVWCGHYLCECCFTTMSMDSMKFLDKVDVKDLEQIRLRCPTCQRRFPRWAVKPYVSEMPPFSSDFSLSGIDVSEMPPFSSDFSLAGMDMSIPTCPVCFDVMTTGGTRKIMSIFWCGHCLCKSCLDLLLATSVGRPENVGLMEIDNLRLRCPSCRMSFPRWVAKEVKLKLDGISERVLELDTFDDCLRATAEELHGTAGRLGGDLLERLRALDD